MTAAIDITTEQRKTLLALLRQFIPGVAVWAYGSRVKWTARPNSDLDLVAFTTPEQRHLVSELKEAFGESNLPFLVDFHVWDEVPERFHEIIRKEYIVLQAAKQPDNDSDVASKWSIKTVAEIQAAGALLVEDGNHGENRPRPQEFSTEGTLFIRAADMDGGRVLFESAQCINEAARQRVRKGVGAGGDVLLSHKGTVGKVAYVPLDAPPFVCSPQTTFWRVKDTNQLDRRYIYYFLLSRAFREQLDSRKGETDMADYVSLTTQRTLKVTIPPLPEQKAIAYILGTLDDKIELNRRMNATLEAMKRALFQNWFVDFDPVRAKLDGCQPAGLDAATAALFPAHFQDSPLGHIPQGWTVESVGEVVSCVGGGTPSTAESKFWEGGTHHWTTPKDFSSLQAPILLDTDRKITDAGIAKISSGLLPAGTLLLSSRAPVGYLAISAIPVAINQGFIAMKCNERASNLFMLNWCQTNMAEIESRATGTTFAEISKQNFRPILVELPPKELMAAFTEKVAPLYAQITANLHQSRTLATLRDTLLPRLMSGKLSVPNSQLQEEELV
jgi:type I restriction enzyme S subunit